MPDEEAPRSGTEAAVVGFTRGEMFSTAHGGEKLHACDVCGAMVFGGRTGRHAEFHRGQGSWAAESDAAEPKPEPKPGRMNEQIRCPDPHCGWRKDTAGMAAFRDGLGELRTHYVNAHVATPQPPEPKPGTVREQVRCPSPGCRWRTDTVGMRGYLDGLYALNKHYATEHAERATPPPSTAHTTPQFSRGYAAAIRWTCHRAGHPVDPVSFDGPAGERCICGTWASAVEQGGVKVTW